MFTYRKERTPFMQRKKGSILLYQTFAFLMAEKERFSHNAASGIACTVATKAFALPRPTELGRQKPSCRHSKNLPSSATGGGRFFSLSHRYAVRDSNLAPPTQKGYPVGWQRCLDYSSCSEVSRKASFACTVATTGFFCPCSSLG